MNERRRRGRLRAIALGALALGGLATALSFVPTDQFLILPGIARPVAELVSVSEGKKDAVGRFLLVTVSAQPASALHYVYGRLHPAADLESKERVLGPDGDIQRYQEETRRMMDESKGVAAVAALRALGRPARVIGGGARVTTVFRGGPAEGRLQRDDIVVAVNGQPVTVAEDLIELVGRAPIGAELTLMVRRGGADPFPVSLVTVPHPDRPGRAAIRVGVANAPARFDLPLDIRIDPQTISGPSAGLMFALEIVDQLVPEDLTGGMVIAGTGTITPDGRVGPVGGVRQKVIAAERAGASVFLVPRDDAPRARRAARRLRVVPVDTLQEALDALRRLPHG